MTFLKVHGNRCAKWKKQEEGQGNSTEDPEISCSRIPEARDESTLEKEPEFKVDLGIEGIAPDVILKDEERMGKTHKVVVRMPHATALCKLSLRCLPKPW